MKEEIVKKCRKHGELTLGQVKQETSKEGYLTYRCHLCKIEKDRRWKKNNREQHIAASARWKKNNREYYNAWCREDRKKDPKKYNDWSKIGREKLGILRSIREVTKLRGISIEDYFSMVGEQDNKCAICFKKETRASRTKGFISRLCIDHNHETGMVRGLLCHACNQVIGHSGDNIEILESAIKYLKKHQI